jgi:CheY-like chemotaxis protein
MLRSSVVALFGDSHDIGSSFALRHLRLMTKSPASDGAHLKRRSLVLVTGRKLLLADDSVTIQKVVNLTFSDEGLEVVTVSDGQQALEKLEEFTPDIVLVDVFMPKVNGYEVCEHIKRDERFRHIPVMLLVGSFEPFDEAEARRVGADDYLTKPFQSIRTLIGKVRNLLTGGSAQSDDATTRQLAPPPEAEKVKHPDSDFLELSTADTIPLPDVNEEERAGVSPKVPFTDLSMDDEMIEATPASDYSHTGQVSQTRMTAQYSAADLKEAGIAQPIESAPAQEETVGALASTLTSEPSHAAASQPQSAPRVSTTASSDDALLDLGDIEPPPRALAEADDFFLDLLDETPAQPHAQESIAAHVVGDESAEFAPVEVQVAPVADDEPRQEAQYQTPDESVVDAHSAPTQRLPDSYQVRGSTNFVPAAEATHEASAERAASRTGQITLEQLSHEVIEAIARRAVEQLSERVVEQIAWEVVPQLAELLIKRRLEEEKQ